MGTSTRGSLRIVSADNAVEEDRMTDRGRTERSSRRDRIGILQAACLNAHRRGPVEGHPLVVEVVPFSPVVVLAS